MAISTEEVSRIAKLARLQFTEEEKLKLTTELSAILNYVDQLKQVESKISPEIQDEEAVNLMRDDVAVENPSPEELLEQAPGKLDGYLKVKSILE
jgi:aspartyl-tRNA(Asn)/glutamyl-tRNA(Gln) amidotransferase subunit C